MSFLQKCIALFVVALTTSCATPRSHAILGLSYSDQPPRVTMRWECNGETFSTQGTGVCEQKTPSNAKVSVKLPPLEGRVIYSNGQLKETEDFNWAPTAGFWIWKKKPIKDTWAELSLGEIAATFGDWPVALDVTAVQDKVGVIVTRGVLYHRVCNDVDIPCSKLVVKFECAGYSKQTGPGQIGKCERLSGSPQAFRVALKGPDYEATPGAKIYLSAPRLGIDWQSFTPREADFSAGEMKIEIPSVLSGPMLVGIRLEWVQQGVVHRVETRIVVIGFSPDWTGLDQPHWLDHDSQIDLVKPVLSDLLEADLYEGKDLKQKSFTTDKSIRFYKPGPGQVVCAFAWQRDSSDQTALCLDSQLQEVKVP